jgi:CheY-like chemotaxis protein
MMPEMDGWEMMRLLKDQDVVITIPIVVMTAGSTDRVREKRVIKKPFNLETVVALVKEHCGAPNDGAITKAQIAL